MRATAIYAALVTVMAILSSSCGDAADEEKAATNHSEFTNPILLHLAADASQRAQELRMMNGVDAYRTNYSIYHAPTRYSPCSDKASSAWTNQFGTKIDEYTFSPEGLGNWLVDIGFYRLESYTILYPNAPGSAPITFYCTVVSENVRRYLPQDQHAADIHRGLTIPVARREFKAWTYRNRYETPLPGKGNVKVFAGTLTYTMVPLVPDLTFDADGSATVKIILDPDTGHWTVIEYKGKDPSMSIAKAAALNSHCFSSAALNQQLDAALADCNESLRLRPGDANTLDSRAFVYFRMGNYAKAIAEYSAALAGNPKMPSSLYVRGVAKLRTGDTNGGNADVAAAKAIDPKIADRYASFGVKP